ncbi:hypothetical protein CBM2598_P100006 [Cupriavidus taiwanensis]|uniref:Uncharacterized protein n=1 Tax=Cupriavidus taiwanensis TaxID=164546 RepID=A0A7Z7JHL5_9BURK|nr:hypothetical protein CBM2597_P110006 [Cupriavidus taiwanensis]SOZ94987.1 hypothetical protein CBM2598_P100006 [Cupriavidus taiwanensis]SPC25482.1 hypothetical protein CBM2594_P80007 [Cupriavidus taiwanensis]
MGTQLSAHGPAGSLGDTANLPSAGLLTAIGGFFMGLCLEEPGVNGVRIDL